MQKLVYVNIEGFRYIQIGELFYLTFKIVYEFVDQL